jgi:hypothetical protein
MAKWILMQCSSSRHVYRRIPLLDCILRVILAGEA